MTGFLKLISTSMLLIFTYSCAQDSSQGDPITKFKATLTGTQQVPANTSTATGVATITYNREGRTFTVEISYRSGFIPTAGNVHQGALGTNGPVIKSFTSLSGTVISGYLNEPQVADLFSNFYYINIQSSLYPAGEIRGQIIKQ